MRRIAAGAVVSSLISLLGYLARALTGHGAIAATGVGTSVAAGTRMPGVALLGTFFVSSSLLSRVARETGVTAKGSRRDAMQVVANGGVAAVSSLSGLVTRPDLAYVALAGSLAAANADTWATEIGSTSEGRPRLLLSRRVVEAGTSGAVSARGTMGAVAGALLIGGVAGAAGPKTRATGPSSGRGEALPRPARRLALTIGRRAGCRPTLTGSQPGEAAPHHYRRLSLVPRMAGVVIAAGVIGSLVDSVLGETVQERRYCPVCDKITEARVHRCGAPTLHQGGVRGIDNDIVNLACTAAGGLSALAGWAWLSRSPGRPGRSRR